MSRRKWIDGNARLKEILEADPELAARVEADVKEMQDEDRAYAMTLATQ